MSVLEKDLTLNGMRYLYTRSYYVDTDTEKKRIKKFIANNPDIIKPYLSDFHQQESREFLKTVVEEEVDLYREGDFWGALLEEMASLSGDDEQIIRGKANDIIREGDCEYLLAAKLIPDFDWKEMYNEVVMKTSYYRGWFPPQLSCITNNMIEQDSQYFIDSMAEKVFNSKVSPKPNCTFRGSMYRIYVEGGFLDKKTARKIRSDGSEEASVRGVKALIDNEELYDDYTDLILKFSDSKHNGVLMELARNLPIHLLTSIMGCDDQWVKSEINRRMERHELEQINAQKEGAI